MGVNRLAAETSPYLLQHADNPVAKASLAMPTMEVVSASPTRPFGFDT